MVSGSGIPASASMGCTIIKQHYHYRLLYLADHDIVF